MGTLVFFVVYVLAGDVPVLDVFSIPEEPRETAHQRAWEYAGSDVAVRAGNATVREVLLADAFGDPQKAEDELRQLMADDNWVNL